MPRPRTLLTQSSGPTHLYACDAVVPVLQRHYPEHTLLFMAAAEAEALSLLFSPDIHALFYGCDRGPVPVLGGVLTEEMLCRAFEVSQREDHARWRQAERLRAAARPAVVAVWPSVAFKLDLPEAAYHALFYASLVITPLAKRKYPTQPGRVVYLKRLARAVLTRYLFGGPR